MRRSFLAIVLISVIVFCPLFSLAADDESLAQQAEQAGKLREAVTHYVNALQSASEGSSKDQQLREKIISLVQKLTPPPAVPEEAQRYLGRGQAAIEIAKTPDDFLAAISEFKKAARLAPWLAQAYFNLAFMQEKAEQFTEAMRNYKLYLLASPSAADAQEVKTRIYGLELKAERQQKEEREKAASAERERQKQEVLNRFKRLVQGNTYENWYCNWYNLSANVSPEDNRLGCTENEYNGRNWYKWSNSIQYKFIFTFDGKIAFSPGGVTDLELVGTVEGTDIDSIRWTNKKGNPVWIRYRYDWSSFNIDHMRPADDIGYDPSYRYFYQSYRKR